MHENMPIDAQNRTNGELLPEESAAVWEQLLQLAESGDIRAIKLYYEMLEKKRRPAPTSDTAEIESMAAIRRAVFGEEENEE